MNLLYPNAETLVRFPQPIKLTAVHVEGPARACSLRQHWLIRSRYEYVFRVRHGCERVCQASGLASRWTRAGWQTRDGILVLFICFLDQLEAVTAGAVVYDAGLCADARRLLKRRKAIIQR